MSFESGRRMGLYASLIFIIVPVALVIVYGFFILSAIGAVTSAVAGSTAAATNMLAPGISIAFILIAVAGVAAIVMFLLAMHNLSEYYGERGIFTNALYAFLIVIIVGGVFIAAFYIIALSQLSSAATTPTSSTAISAILSVLGLAVALLVVVIVSAVLMMRAFEKLGEKSGVSTFKTAGTLYLIGVVLTIVFFGIFIVWIAWILAATGFHSLKPKTEQPYPVSYSMPQPPPTISQSQELKFCVYCGAPLTADSAYCQRCGKPVMQ